MMKRRFVRAAIGLLLATLAGTAQAAPASRKPPSNEEEALIRHGIELRKARDDVAARGEFQKAYDLGHSPRAAAQLGLAEFALGRWDEAEAHVSEALRAPEDPFITKYRVELDRSLGVIKTHIAHLEVIGEPAGAEVVVNGRAAGRLPLPLPVSVSEGEVDVEVRANGFARGNRTLTVAGGQYQRVVIRLEREAAGAAGAATTGGGARAGAGTGSPAAAIPIAGGAPGEGGDSPMRPPGGAMPGPSPEGHTPDAPPAPPPGDEGGGPSVGRRVVKWTSLGLAGAALATGVAATIIHGNNLSTFESLHGGGCFDNGGRAVDSTGNTVAECQPSLDAYRSARTWQIIGFVGAGVFAATWLVLALTEPTAAEATSTPANHSIATWLCAPTLLAPGAACALRF